MEKRPGRLRQILKVLRKNKIAYGVTPEKLRHTLEDLGPTFIKFGQIFSMRTDLLPLAYTEELAKLRTSVRPMEFSQIREELKAQYGTDPDSIFASIDPTPLGSASIAQVHRAVLKSGEHVVIKIQRPGIRATMYEDIQLLKRAVALLGVIQINETINFTQVLDELWRTTEEELDFRKELENIQTFRAYHRDIAYVAFPQVYPDYSNGSVLVMEEIRGYSIGDKKALRKAGYDCEEIGTRLAESYIKQVLDDGFFHADPHQGNIMIRDDRIVWLDLGMVGQIDAHTKELFRRAIKGIVLWDIQEIENVIIVLGKPTRKVDHSLLYNDIDDFLNKYARASLASIDIAQLLSEFFGLAEAHGIVIPSNLTMLGRGIATIEGVVLDLYPSVDFMQLVYQRAKSWIIEDFDAKETLKKYAINLCSSIDKSVELPGRVYDALRMVTKGQFRTNVETNVSERNLDRIERMVEKVSLSLVLAGSVIATSVLLGLENLPQLWGVSVAGILSGCITCLLGIGWAALLLRDHRKRRKRKK